MYRSKRHRPVAPKALPKAESEQRLFFAPPSVMEPKNAKVFFQAKRTVNAACDVLEREADTTADRADQSLSNSERALPKPPRPAGSHPSRSEEHTSELKSPLY